MHVKSTACFSARRRTSEDDLATGLNSDSLLNRTINNQAGFYRLSDTTTELAATRVTT
jgi:hypothetical protein